MTNKKWKKAVLEKLAETGSLGRESAEYIRKYKARIYFKKYSKSTGARWFLFHQISLNTRYYSTNTDLNNPKLLSLLVHEVHHLKQGVLTALSVYGELDAWQVEYRFHKEISPAKLHSALEEILILPLNWDRDNLRRAAKLMQDYAGKGYRINWLPLYPIHKEITYWVKRKKPA
ncbi:MAG: hypothetical protein HN736_01715 [Anaerolineae bacterium]|jgi:hypothetical protein|nr:hypothetical protein [Anaerolineae bacterium]MBT3714177.1 hypothetical protein [Anaerolineae bacterium]MBT4310776.1 hypothetical protein [Anaerolineae bacterium]MBT4458226.1 hypothetical protein [Anaerolineae bacterium]MBT4841019.1 hypothetical protein [Anaerolineae bacterium]